MTWQRVTAMIIVGVTLCLILYDLITYNVAGNEATLSHVMLSLTQQHPLFAVMVSVNFGVLIGHLFVPQRVYVNVEQSNQTR